MRRIDWLPTLTIAGAILTFIAAMAWAITSMDLLGRMFAVLVISTVVIGVAWAMKEG